MVVQSNLTKCLSHNFVAQKKRILETVHRKTEPAYSTGTFQNRVFVPPKQIAL